MQSVMYKPTIVGSGLLARSLSDYVFDKKLLILAAGVSNSQETRDAEFQREHALITDKISKYMDSTLVYYSTCSLSLNVSTPYTIHKARMEQLLADSGRNFHILRLPQVVGVVKNTTLISFFIEALLSGQAIKLQRFAGRDLIGVDDVSRVTKTLIDSGLGLNSSINLATGHVTPVTEIVQYLASLLNRQCQLEFIDSGLTHKFKVEVLGKFIGEDVIFNPDYWQQALNKHVPLYLAAYHAQ